ncbi:MAG TPA: methyltransferase domain-containing protein [Acidimicrobiales bacterium]|nr:methyltransferase domain-containing protein [Acidimicrobiales bacterium]
MPDVRYTHGHHESVLRSHRWRTAENSAAYLLPHLRAGQSLLDVGCGPGTITADLAARVAPGRSVGLDAAVGILEEARGVTESAAVGLVAGDVLQLPFADASFDVVHAHQVLQHLGRPVEALAEMRRVCRPGGLVAARDSDYPAMTWFPDDGTIADAFEAYGTMTRINGANWDAGRRLLSWARAAGFARVVPSASVWCYATPDERRWWGDLWAERFTASALAEQLVTAGVSDRRLEEFAAGFRRWAAQPDGWFAVLHGEVVATP